MPSVVETKIFNIEGHACPRRSGRRVPPDPAAVGTALGRLGRWRLSGVPVLSSTDTLSNALKFTSEGGWVEVLARVVDGMAEISVTDTGGGIAQEDQEAVFEEFRQVGTSALVS